MFVQVVQGRVRDTGATRQLLERWRQDVAPGAVGLLSAAAGVTDDGWLLHVARFRSAGDAGIHAARPEQIAWWEQLDGLLEGRLRFHDCNEVALVDGGGDDSAGFVQVIQSRGAAGLPVPRVVGRLQPLLRRHRPDVIGGVLARAEDGTVTQVVYCTSEAEAREHEGADVPEDEAVLLRELWGEEESEVRSFELRSPVLISC